MTRKSPEPAAAEARTAVFPGTFDPFTRGHMSVLRRALTLFDRIVVGIGFSPAKAGAAAGARARAEALAALLADEPRVEVTAYEGLTVDLCRRCGARFIVRGVRSVADFEYERPMADINRRIGGGIETVLLYTLPEDASISSSMVRELASHGVDTTPFLP